MSLISNNDILLYLQEIHTSECFIPGQYKLELVVLKKIKNDQTHEIDEIALPPYFIALSPNREKSENENDFTPGKISKDMKKYTSQIFNISENSEKISLEEGILFKLNNTQKLPLFSIEIIITIFGKKSNKKKIWNYGIFPGIDDEFEKISVKSIAIRDANKNTRLPIDFYLGAKRTSYLIACFYNYTTCFIKNLQFFKF